MDKKVICYVLAVVTSQGPRAHCHVKIGNSNAPTLTIPGRDHTDWKVLRRTAENF